MTRPTELMALKVGSPAVTVCSLKNPFGVVHVQITAVEIGTDAMTARIRLQHAPLQATAEIPGALETGWSPESPLVRAPFGGSTDVQVIDQDGKAWKIVGIAPPLGEEVYVMDGAYINKPDEGNNYRGTAGAQLPYFDNNQAQEAGGPTFFSPNRQMPSAVMFGSLPTGIFADGGVGRSWRTLLFRPDPNGGHTGATTPKDHLLLDLFWMPVVEPYAISEPFSTAGKINLNCQVAPFTYIKRTTALRALLKSERVIAIPNPAIWPGVSSSTSIGRGVRTTSTSFTTQTKKSPKLRRRTSPTWRGKVSVSSSM